MQAPSEAPVREENQIDGPPLMTQHVCLCIAFSNLVLEETQIVDPPLPPNVHVYLFTLAFIFFYVA